MALRNYTNNAPPQALTVQLAASSGATTATVASTTGYPSPPFIVGLERGTTNQEVCLCTALTGTTLTLTRAYDGTTANLHAIGATLEHTSAAIDYREANAFINLMSTLGDLIVFGPSGPARLPAGTNGQALVANSDATNGVDFATITYRAVHTYSVSGLLVVASGAIGFLPPFYFPVPAAESVTLAGVYASVRGGTSVALAVQQNGSPVAGLSDVVATTTPTWTAVSGTVDVANNDAFAPVISGITGTPDGLSLSLYYDIVL